MQLESKRPDPEELWNVYCQFVYDGELVPKQDRDLRMAFYAGIETTFRVIDELAEDDASDEESYAMLIEFRVATWKVAHLANLERGDGNS